MGEKMRSPQEWSNEINRLRAWWRERFNEELPRSTAAIMIRDNIVSVPEDWRPKGGA